MGLGVNTQVEAPLGLEASPSVSVQRKRLTGRTLETQSTLHTAEKSTWKQLNLISTCSHLTFYY